MSSSSSPTILRDNGTITITPKKETDQSALIVIAHGLGDSAEGFVDVAEVRA
jgi:predicted esterase